MHPTRIDLPAKVRAKSIATLNAVLADLIDLGLQLKQAHWNIKGPGFHAIHELLDEIHGQVNDHADEVAERAVTLGGQAMGTLRAVAKATTLAKFPEDLNEQTKVLKEVADRLAAAAKTVRAAVDTTDDNGDTGTSDLLTGLSRTLDKNLWFIEAHL